MSVFVPWSICLPLCTGLIKMRLLNKSAKIIWYYLLVSALIGFGATYTGRVLHHNNLPLIHIYTALEVILFCQFYKTVLQAPSNSMFYKILPAAFVLFCVINALFFQSIFSYSSYTRSVEALICILFAMNYFARLASIDSEKRISMLPEFYFNTGIFIYFSGGFMLFVFSNFVSNLSLYQYEVIWVLYSALVLCMYLFFSIAYLLCKK
jgi:hypothetical protein